MESVYRISLKFYLYLYEIWRKQINNSIMIQYFYLFFFIIYLKNHQARVQTIFLFDIIGKITRDVEHVYILMQHKKKKK